MHYMYYIQCIDIVYIHSTCVTKYHSYYYCYRAATINMSRVLIYIIFLLLFNILCYVILEYCVMHRGYQSIVQVHV